MGLHAAGKRSGHGVISLVQAAAGQGGRLLAASVLLSCVLLSLVLWIRPLSRLHRSSDVLQVRTVEMVDRTGAVRLRIGVSADGTPSVRLYDYAGTRRLELAVGSDGPAVAVFDGHGVERRILTASPELEPSSEDAAAGP